MWQRSRALAFTLVLGALSGRALGEDVKPVDPATNSPKESLRLQLFKDAPATPACLALKIDPRGNAKALEADFDAFLRALVKAVKEKNEKGLQALFHKRLGVGLPAIAETLGKLDVVYGKPIDVSVFRVWALNTVDGSPAPLACETDATTVSPHYGYPLQFVVWLQVMGSAEIGRIFVSAVPADGRWNIGAFHIQQWTHAGKDPAAWTEDAIKTARAGQREAAFAKYDLAAKLLDGGKLYDIAARADVEKARDAVMSREDWDKSIRAALKGHEVIHTATLFVTEGAGILVRVRVPGEISVEDIKSTCARIGTTLSEQPWAQSMGGVRCAFNMPREDAAKDGGLGGIYLSFKDARALDAKAKTK